MAKANCNFVEIFRNISNTPASGRQYSDFSIKLQRIRQHHFGYRSGRRLKISVLQIIENKYLSVVERFDRSRKNQRLCWVDRVPKRLALRLWAGRHARTLREWSRATTSKSGIGAIDANRAHT
jgi:hypothetical protein